MTDKSSFRNTSAWRPPSRDTLPATSASGAISNNSGTNRHIPGQFSNAPVDRSSEHRGDRAFGGSRAELNHNEQPPVAAGRERASSSELPPAVRSPTKGAAWASNWKAGNRDGESTAGGSDASGAASSWSKSSRERDGEGSGGSGWVRGRGLLDKKDDAGGEPLGTSFRSRALSGAGAGTGVTSALPTNNRFPREAVREREFRRPGAGFGDNDESGRRPPGMSKASYTPGSSSAGKDVWTRAKPVDSIDKPADG